MVRLSLKLITSIVVGIIVLIVGGTCLGVSLSTAVDSIEKVGTAWAHGISARSMTNFTRYVSPAVVSELIIQRQHQLESSKKKQKKSSTDNKNNIEPLPGATSSMINDETSNNNNNKNSSGMSTKLSSDDLQIDLNQIQDERMAAEY